MNEKIGTRNEYLRLQGSEESNRCLLGCDAV